MRALADFAHAGTEDRLGTLFAAAAHAVDVLGLDEIEVIQFVSKICRPYAELVVVVDGCDSCIAFLTVQAAGGYKPVFHFSFPSGSKIAPIRPQAYKVFDEFMKNEIMPFYGVD